MAFGGLKIFDKLNFSLRRGERHAVIGPNGAGKSTFVNLVTGFSSPRAVRSCSRAATSLMRRRSNACTPDSSERSRSTRCSRRSIRSNRSFWRSVSAKASRAHRGVPSAA
jgi:ABC-type branched-subunit amino acid transport system ATPase component